MRRLVTAVGLVLLIVVLVSYAVYWPGQAQEPVQYRFTYASVPIDRQIQEADYIVAGTVKGISGTRWNQDSGEYWEERVQHEKGDTLYTALPYYTIELLVDQPIVGEARPGQTLVLTQVGMSPDDREAGGAGFSRHLRVGDHIVMFAVHREMGWRNGTRPIVRPFTVPESACFVRGDDSLYETAQLTEKLESEDRVLLEHLFARISRVRNIQVQPVDTQS